MEQLADQVDNSSSVVSFISLPSDQQLSIVHSLGLQERLALRTTCTCLHSLTSDPGVFGALAASLWRTCQHAKCPPPCASTATATYGDVSIVPACLAATLADACARVPRMWPSTLSRMCLATLGHGDAVLLAARHLPVVDFANVADGGPEVRLTAQGAVAAFDMHNTPLLAAAISDRPFPHMKEGSAPGVFSPRAPLPFATPAPALGVAGHARSWALRLTAYFEATLCAPPPAEGSLCIGLVDDNAVASTDRLAREATGAEQIDSAAATALRARRGGLFLEIGSVLIEGDEDDESSSRVRLKWWDGGGQRRRTLALPRVVAGDRIGVCINYVAATASWTHNGKLLPDSEISIALSCQWHAAICASGTTSVRVNFGTQLSNDSQSDVHCFAFDVLQLESSLWHDLHGKAALRELYKRNVAPSKSFLSAFASTHEGGSGRSMLTPAGWPWSPGPSWAYTVESYLDPWLHRHRRPVALQLERRQLDRQPADLQIRPRQPPQHAPSDEAVRPPPPASADAWVRLSANAPLAEVVSLDPCTEGHVIEKTLRMLLRIARVSQTHAAALLLLRLSLPTLLTASPPQLARVATEAQLPLGARTRLAHGVEAIQRSVQAAISCKQSAEHSAGLPAVGPQLLSSGGHSLTAWCELCMLLQLGRLPLSLVGTLLDAGASARSMCAATPETLRAITRRARLSSTHTQRFVESVRDHLLLLSTLDTAKEEEEAAEAKLDDGAYAEDATALEAAQAQPPSRLTILLAAVLPPDAVTPCALRLLAHGVTVSEALAHVWPRGASVPSQSGLASLLVRTGLAVGHVQGLVAHMRMSPPPRLPPPLTPAPPARLQAPSQIPLSLALPARPGFVEFRVIVSDPQSIGPKTFLVVHSDAMDWGRRGWTATLRPRDEARATAGEACCFIGAWGAHAPDFTRAAVAPGMREVVLALSGEDDGYNGWGRALHKEAGQPNEHVEVNGGQTTTVHFHLTIGPPVVLRRV